MRRPEEQRRYVLTQLIGALIVMFVIVAATIWMSSGANVVTDRAVDKVGGFYLQELAGHRTQVISGSLETKFDQMRRAVELMTEENVDTEQKARAFIAKVEDLLDLEQFAVVDEDDVVYTRYATYMGGSRYGFLNDGSLEKEEVITSTSLYGANKQACLAIPVSGLSISGKPLKACFVQVDINKIVRTLTTDELDTGTSFCIYHRNGDNLTKLDFGPIGVNQNLLVAMRSNLSEEDWKRLKSDFENGQQGRLDFNYEGNNETLFYEAIPESHWMLTVLVAEHLIQDQIRGVGDEMILRSTVLIVISGLMLLAFFGLLIHRIRKESKAQLEEERQHAKDVGEMAQRTEQELGTVKEVAYKDVLTGVNSRYSFTKEELALDEAIKAGSVPPFAVVVCDVNNLKRVNDEQGHAAGDELIRDACKVICHSYVHSPVYRVGGDEFVVLLKGYDYDHRDEISSQFNKAAEEALTNGKVVVALGMGVYRPEDKSLHDVFLRADKRMYERKAQLKHLA